MLRKLKKLNLPFRDLVTIYVGTVGYIRPILEYCASALHSSITVEQNNNLEKIQRRVRKIIVWLSYVTYSNACQVCNLPTLDERRLALCRKFTISLSNHSIGQTKKKTHSYISSPYSHLSAIPIQNNKVENSPLSFLVDIINKSCYTFIVIGGILTACLLPPPQVGCFKFTYFNPFTMLVLTLMT